MAKKTISADFQKAVDAMTNTIKNRSSYRDLSPEEKVSFDKLVAVSQKEALVVGATDVSKISDKMSVVSAALTGVDLPQIGVSSGISTNLSRNNEPSKSFQAATAAEFFVGIAKKAKIDVTPRMQETLFGKDITISSKGNSFANNDASVANIMRGNQAALLNHLTDPKSKTADISHLMGNNPSKSKVEIVGTYNKKSAFLNKAGQEASDITTNFLVKMTDNKGKETFMPMGTADLDKMLPNSLFEKNNSALGPNPDRKAKDPVNFFQLGMSAQEVSVLGSSIHSYNAIAKSKVTDLTLDKSHYTINPDKSIVIGEGTTKLLIAADEILSLPGKDGKMLLNAGFAMPKPLRKGEKPAAPTAKQLAFSGVMYDLLGKANVPDNAFDASDKKDPVVTPKWSEGHLCNTDMTLEKARECSRYQGLEGPLGVLNDLASTSVTAAKPTKTTKATKATKVDTPAPVEEEQDESLEIS